MTLGGFTICGACTLTEVVAEAVPRVALASDEWYQPTSLTPPSLVSIALTPASAFLIPGQSTSIDMYQWKKRALDLFLLICLFSLFDHVLAWFTLPNIFSSFCFNMTSAGERPWRPSHRKVSVLASLVQEELQAL